jgi:CubicO group peptidase (beta-lactamase class C family)
MLALFLLMAQEPAAVRDLHELLAERLAQAGMPAVAALVTNGEHTLAAGVAGVRARGGEQAATLDDRWHIGSCTKSMTATVAALMVEDGKLSWEATLASVFPELAAGMDSAWQDATLARLLTNTAGAVGDLGGVHPKLWERFWKDNLAPVAQRSLLVETLTALPPAKPPGSTFLYSNAGFSLAGAMLERADGVVYEDLMRTHLFEPLGMTSAGFGAPEGESAPWGHGANGKPVRPGRGADNPAAIAPAGRVHLTLEDWAKYARRHLRIAREEGPLRRLHVPATESGRARYACGWSVAEVGDPPLRILGHSGSNTMWYSVIWLVPELDLAILTACNDGTQGAALERLTADLLTEFR